MSVLTEFAMFPTDKGTSVSTEVSKIIETIRDSGFNYKLGAMGTTIETETLAEAFEIIELCYNSIEPASKRVYASIKLDIRKGESDRLLKKIESIEKKIGNVNK